MTCSVLLYITGLKLFRYLFVCQVPEVDEAEVDETEADASAPGKGL